MDLLSIQHRLLYRFMWHFIWIEKLATWKCIYSVKRSDVTWWKQGYITPLSHTSRSLSFTEYIYGHSSIWDSIYTLSFEPILPWPVSRECLSHEPDRAYRMSLTVSSTTISYSAYVVILWVCLRFKPHWMFQIYKYVIKGREELRTVTCFRC